METLNKTKNNRRRKDLSEDFIFLTSVINIISLASRLYHRKVRNFAHGMEAAFLPESPALLDTAPCRVLFFKSSIESGEITTTLGRWSMASFPVTPRLTKVGWLKAGVVVFILSSIKKICQFINLSFKRRNYQYGDAR